MHKISNLFRTFPSYLGGIMNREQLLTELESLFDLPADSLRGDQQLQDIPAWDSVAVLGVISLADEINGRDLSPLDFQHIFTVNDIINLIFGDASRS